MGRGSGDRLVELDEDPDRREVWVGEPMTAFYSYTRRDAGRRSRLL